MKIFSNQVTYAKHHPVLTGVATIVLTLMLGVATAYILGATKPFEAHAVDVLTPCCVVIPDIPLPPPPLLPVLPPPVLPKPDVLTPCCTVVPVTPELPPTPPPTLPPPDVLTPCCTVIPDVPEIPPEIPPVIPPPDLPPPVVVIPPPPDNPPPPPPPSAECIALTASPNVITHSGQEVTLTLATRNVNSATVNGMAIPVNGSIKVNPTDDTTYVATVSNGTNSINCQTSVDLQPPTITHEVPRCIDLNANKTTIKKGEEVILTWHTDKASSASIDQGVGPVAVQSGSTTVKPTRDTTYTLTVPGAAPNSACHVAVNIKTGGGGNGHSNGSSSKPKAFLDSITRPAEAPLGAVYLADIPYTGLDLGPVGTVVYWLMLIAWSLAAAYLVLFNLIPYLFRRRATASAGQENTGGHLPGWGPSAQSASMQHVAQSAAPAAPAIHNAAHQAAVAQAMARPVQSAPASKQDNGPVYSPHEGFRSYARGGALTIDDIVKGLSRESGMVFQPSVTDQQPAHAAAPSHDEAPAQREVAQAAPERAPAAATVRYSDDLVDFLEHLLNGNRDHVFGTVRSINKQGGDVEHFLSQAVCALDDAYRARVEGTDVHPEIARVTKECHTSFLERLVSSLATAVDSSYSAGVTGSKLALTRALAVVNG